MNKQQKDKIQAWQELNPGMFIHFGVYSQYGGVYKGKRITEGYSEQIMQFAGIPEEDYLATARTMTLDKFDPEAIVSLAKASEMKYILLTAKHHDGFCLFETKTTDFNLVEQTPFGQDLVKILAAECRKQGLQFGLYFSLVDWHLGHAFDPDNWNRITPEIEAVLCEQLTELMTGYGELCEIWFDMSRPALEQSKRFIAIVRAHQPQAMINSRIGNGLGDFITFWDNQIPDEAPLEPWQTPQSIYPETWGYRSWQKHDDLEDRARIIIENYESVHSRGGNYLLNIGPRGDGSVTEFEQEILLALGRHIRSK